MTLPQTPSFRLEGKRALVTGASSGIGLACAAACAQAGAHTVLAARRKEPLDAAVAEITAAGGSAEAVVLDVSDIAATAEVVERMGPFDVLVNSAGVARHGPSIETQPEADRGWKARLSAADFIDGKEWIAEVTKLRRS